MLLWPRERYCHPVDPGPALPNLPTPSADRPTATTWEAHEDWSDELWMAAIGTNWTE